MANIASSKKRARQNIVRNQRNSAQRSMLRTYIKKVRLAIESKDKAEAQRTYQRAVPIIDRMCSKGLIHKNRAARYKSRLNRHLLTLSAG
ncbi:MAG: 30S ribosomal protein S20 [Candidatus Eutrophobiaceae bacterium]